MMLKTFAVSLVAVVVLGAGLFGGAATAAPFCKALKGESVAIGEPDARKDAEDALTKAIAEWSEHYRTPAVPKNRKMACKVYIEFLGEYACTAEATVCRETGSAPKAAAKAPNPAR